MDLRFQRSGTPTGRPWGPEFVVRSGADPPRVQSNFDEWATAWAQALEPTPESAGNAPRQPSALFITAPSLGECDMCAFL